MKRSGPGNRNTSATSAGKVMMAALVGSVVGATVGILMASSSGRKLRRRIKGQVMGSTSAFEKAQVAARHGESRARELAARARYHMGEAKGFYPTAVQAAYPRNRKWVARLLEN